MAIKMIIIELKQFEAVYTISMYVRRYDNILNVIKYCCDQMIKFTVQAILADK